MKRLQEAAKVDLDPKFFPPAPAGPTPATADADRAAAAPRRRLGGTLAVHPDMTARKILVVEDNDMNMQLVEFLLEEGGYDIVKATSGEEALAHHARRPAAPDLILMDIHLPGMDGLSVVRAMKADERTARIPILALTAHAMRGDKDRFLEAGCDGYISKPIDVKTFISSIEQYL